MSFESVNTKVGEFIRVCLRKDPAFSYKCKVSFLNAKNVVFVNV